MQMIASVWMDMIIILFLSNVTSSFDNLCCYYRISIVVISWLLTKFNDLEPIMWFLWIAFNGKLTKTYYYVYARYSLGIYALNVV